MSTHRTTIARALVAVTLAAAATAQSSARDWTEWNERTAEHLLNRAGFGATDKEVRAWAKRSRAELVEHLFTIEPPETPFFYDDVPFDREALSRLDPAERRVLANKLRRQERGQGKDFVHWWFAEMIETEHPLRERMTLFWHGFFTSGISKVKRSYPMIRQNEFLRANAIGNYADLLRGILKDPAMLIYLDNDQNEKQQPNENLAREVMELFSLGEGNYTERDVQEAARALTGRGSMPRGQGYRYDRGKHDYGEKQILGQKGRFDGDDLAGILLEQDACSRWVAGRLIEYFEGVPPTEDRLAEYAGILKRHDYDIEVFLRGLFVDPRFYREEVLSARVQSPVDYLVGLCRRLDLQPPPAFLSAGSGVLGQALLDPPNVKGWEGGISWISTSTLMMRGNLAGALLGLVDIHDLENDPTLILEDPRLDDSNMGGAAMGEMGMGSMDDPTMDAEEPAMGAEARSSSDVSREVRRGARADAEERARRSPFKRVLATLENAEYHPRIHFTASLLRRGIATDRAIVDALLDQLLAIDAPDETRRELRQFLKVERRALGIENDSLLEIGPAGERILRRLAHLILSLPEAQLS